MLFSSEHMIQITDDLRIESYDFVFNIAVMSEFNSRIQLTRQVEGRRRPLDCDRNEVDDSWFAPF